MATGLSRLLRCTLYFRNGSFSSDRPAPDALGMSASLRSRPEPDRVAADGEDDWNRAGRALGGKRRRGGLHRNSSDSALQGRLPWSPFFPFRQRGQLSLFTLCLHM